MWGVWLGVEGVWFGVEDVWFGGEGLGFGVQGRGKGGSEGGREGGTGFGVWGGACKRERRDGPASGGHAFHLVRAFGFQFKNNSLAEIWSGTEEGSYLRLIDCCSTQL